MDICRNGLICEHADKLILADNLSLANSTTHILVTIELYEISHNPQPCLNNSPPHFNNSFVLVVAGRRWILFSEAAAHQQTTQKGNSNYVNKNGNLCFNLFQRYKLMPK